jgi:hypothetical protein
MPLKKVPAIIVAAGVFILVCYLLYRPSPRQKFARISFGMRSNEVLAILGPPTDIFRGRDYNAQGTNYLKGDSWTYRYPLFQGIFITFTTNGTVLSLDYISGF